MSIIRSIEVSLSELVEDSNLIVKVKFEATFKENLHVVDKSKDQGDQAIPPFIKKGCIFRVLGVLKNTARIEVPEKVQVPDENWRRSMGQHREKHAGGSSKAYNVATYNTEVTSPQKAVILFLQHFQGMFDLAAKNAFENKDAEEKIKILLESS